MRYVLITKPYGDPSRDEVVKAMGIAKRIVENPESVVPNAKLLFAYAGKAKPEFYTVWEASDPEGLAEEFLKFTPLGFHTELLPVESLDEWLARFI